MSVIDDLNKTPLITYGMFLKDNTKKYKSDIFNTQNRPYYEINDKFFCPNHKLLEFRRYAYYIDRYGFKRDFKLYECDDCLKCLLKNRSEEHTSELQSRFDLVCR